jgi:hypothetical protein
VTTSPISDDLESVITARAITMPARQDPVCETSRGGAEAATVTTSPPGKEGIEAS